MTSIKTIQSKELFGCRTEKSEDILNQAMNGQGAPLSGAGVPKYNQSAARSMKIIGVIRLLRLDGLRIMCYTDISYY